MENPNKTSERHIQTHQFKEWTDHESKIIFIIKNSLVKKMDYLITLYWISYKLMELSWHASNELLRRFHSQNLFLNFFHIISRPHNTQMFFLPSDKIWFYLSLCHLVHFPFKLNHFSTILTSFITCKLGQQCGFIWWKRREGE